MPSITFEKQYCNCIRDHSENFDFLSSSLVNYCPTYLSQPDLRIILNVSSYKKRVLHHPNDLDLDLDLDLGLDLDLHLVLNFA